MKRAYQDMDGGYQFRRVMSVSRPTDKPYTDIGLANNRILELEEFCRDSIQASHKLIEAAQVDFDELTKETRKYRTLATETTDRMLKREREIIKTKQEALDSLTRILCLDNPKSYVYQETCHEGEGQDPKLKAALQEMMDFFGDACNETGMPV